MPKLSLLATNAIVVLIAWLWASGLSLEQLEAWLDSGVAPPRGGYKCSTQTGKMRPKFLSYDPVMVYIEGFLSPYETAHLSGLA